MLDTTAWRAANRSYQAPPCAQCGQALIAPTWSEHVSERCVRHVWSCEACGYEFETAVYLHSSAA
jgi:ribosomal protein L37AE/L43A